MMVHSGFSTGGERFCYAATDDGASPRVPAVQRKPDRLRNGGGGHRCRDIESAQAKNSPRNPSYRNGSSRFEGERRLLLLPLLRALAEADVERQAGEALAQLLRRKKKAGRTENS